MVAPLIKQKNTSELKGIEKIQVRQLMKVNYSCSIQVVVVVVGVLVDVDEVVEVEVVLDVVEVEVVLEVVEVDVARGRTDKYRFFQPTSV